jgi:hypothetical protein
MKLASATAACSSICIPSCPARALHSARGACSKVHAKLQVVCSYHVTVRCNCNMLYMYKAEVVLSCCMLCQVSNCHSHLKVTRALTRVLVKSTAEHKFVVTLHGCGLTQRRCNPPLNIPACNALVLFGSTGCQSTAARYKAEAQLSITCLEVAPATINSHSIL